MLLREDLVLNTNNCNKIHFYIRFSFSLVKLKYHFNYSLTNEQKSDFNVYKTENLHDLNLAFNPFLSTAMKRFALIIVVILSALQAYSQADDLSKWSFTGEYGFKASDRDGDSSVQPTFGASVEYAFFPFAGLSVDYYHFLLSGTTFKTRLNASDLNATVNFSRLFFSGINNKVILNGSVGFGLASYSSKYNSTTSSSAYSLAVSFPVMMLSVEYNLITTLALGAKIQYRPFNKDNLEGDPVFDFNEVSNDNILAVTAYLRLRSARIPVFRPIRMGRRTRGLPIS